MFLLFNRYEILHFRPHPTYKGYGPPLDVEEGSRPLRQEGERMGPKSFLSPSN